MDWRDRFRAGAVHWASRARRNPGAVSSSPIATATTRPTPGTSQPDAAPRVRRRVRPSSRRRSRRTAHRSSILLDTTGSEFGHLHRVPFEGGESVDLTPDLDDYLAYEIRVGDEVVTAVIGFENSQRSPRASAMARPRTWDQEALALAAIVSRKVRTRIAIGEPMDGMIGRTVVRSLVDGSEIDRLDRLSHGWRTARRSRSESTATAGCVLRSGRLAGRWSHRRRYPGRRRSRSLVGGRAHDPALPAPPIGGRALPLRRRQLEPSRASRPLQERHRSGPA